MAFKSNNEFMNSTFNGHQAFRATEVVVVFITYVALCVADRPRVLNIQLTLGWVTLLAVLLVFEALYRRETWVLWTKDDKSRTHASNLKLAPPYPAKFFYWDLIALALIVWGTGGILSPYFPLLYFLGFVASLSVDDKPLSAIIVISAIIVAVAPVVDLIHVPTRHVFGIPVSLGYLKEYTPNFDGRGWPSLTIAVITNAIFFILSNELGRRAGRYYRHHAPITRAATE